MQARVNGLLVLRGEIYEPQRGPWSARLELDQTNPATAPVTGPVRLEIGSETFLGTGYGSAESGRHIIEVVGGSDGLRTELDAKYYWQTTASVVVDDVLRATKEILDVQLTDPVITSFRLTRWARRKGEARGTLSDLVGATGGFWRITRRGMLVLRRDEEWETVEGTYTEVGRDPAEHSVVIAPDETAIARPGQTLPSGERILEVTTELEASSLRQRIAFDDGSGKMRSVAHASIDAAQRAAEGVQTFSQWYPARVVSQDRDGSVQIIADDPRIRGNGITHVPLRHGVPGVTVRVTPNEKVILFFEDGDPQKPACALWPDGSSVREVRNSATERLVFASPEVLVGGDDASHAMVLGDVLDQLLRSLQVSTAMGPSGFPIPTPLWDQYLSKRHKLDG